MKFECVFKIWNRSRDYGLEYYFMVFDGNLKVYNLVWDVYGVCSDCNKYDWMEKLLFDYIKWKNFLVYK